jgi:hypothetical protein
LVCFFRYLIVGDFDIQGLIHAAHDNEEVTRGQATHQDTYQTLERPEKPPWFHQHHVTVTNRRLRSSRKIKCRFGIRLAPLPQVEERPYGNLRKMKQGQPPDHSQQDHDESPDADRRSLERPQEIACSRAIFGLSPRGETRS